MHYIVISIPDDTDMHTLKQITQQIAQTLQQPQPRLRAVPHSTPHIQRTPGHITNVVQHYNLAK